MTNRKKSPVDVASDTENKDPHAVALGRKGGLKGGPARAKKLTPEQRSESARRAVTARWARYKAAKSELAKKGEKKSSKKGRKKA